MCRLCGQMDWICNWWLFRNSAIMLALVILTVDIAADLESKVSSKGTLPEFKASTY